MRFLYFLTTILFFFFNQGISQKKFTNPEKANELKIKYEDATVVGQKSITNYEFEIFEDNLQITQKDKVQLISLQSNVKYRRSVFFNDNIQLKNSSVKYASGKGCLKSDKVC
ncbi:MAG: hypothetical protein KAI29_09360, partial [Cyclobacteriaceae bacterium]|nr:hypothetical protein [Cyclobacteriaceae bacterium]